MSKPSATKTADDAPITQADIDSGRLVLTKRHASGKHGDRYPQGDS